jgi:hypothetical protein
MGNLILGIDAAWTETNPSGVALVAAGAGDTPQLLRVARTSTEFTSGRILSTGDWLSTPPSSGLLNVKQLLDTVKRYAFALPSIIVLDIPLSPLPICGRRAADDAISIKYAKRWAGTHTPSKELTGAGYNWIDISKPEPSNGHIRWFIETYPHPVIIDMLRLGKRLCYKVAKRQKYWPNSTPDERWRNVASELDRLRGALALRIGSLTERVPKACAILDAMPKSRGAVFKGIEDVLDAVVCALVGWEFLGGRTVAFGDQYSAIWVPRYNRERAATDTL